MLLVSNLQIHGITYLITVVEYRKVQTNSNNNKKENSKLSHDGKVTIISNFKHVYFPNLLFGSIFEPRTYKIVFTPDQEDHPHHHHLNQLHLVHLPCLHCPCHPFLPFHPSASSVILHFFHKMESLVQCFENE